ncbi:MAG TPA: hypothetical protein VFN67_09540 [Polyangiales bacterium]|nr:hypothetical protein [Polyangiales bacterium]
MQAAPRPNARTPTHAHHVHSLARLAHLLLSAAGVLFELLPKPMTALFSPCHSVRVGWLAKRSTLTATSLRFIAPCALLRTNRRNTGAAYGWLVAGTLASLAVASGEFGVCPLFFGVLNLN